MSNRRTVTCPNDECEADIEVFFEPGSPGNTYGPPERCYPPDPPLIDGPAECPKCGRIFTHRDENAWIERLEEGGSR